MNSLYRSGLAILGADQSAPGKSMSTPLTPAQLNDLDRKLTPEEQARVTAWQSGQADAMQAKEEATPYVNPVTGKKTIAKVTYETDPTVPTRRVIVEKVDEPAGTPGWIIAVAVAVFGYGTYRLTR